MPFARDKSLLRAAPLLAAALLLGSCGLEETLAFTLPAIVVALPLLLGRYPGETRLARRRAPARRGYPRPRSLVVPHAWRRDRRAPESRVRPMAGAVAVRPPPAPAVG